ncbi:GYD domain-containing protein [Hyphomicrobium sp. 2TAF46]|uniref:GYD domain-containing protein n=1 Tax=Hyphomicrobium sp. 2TAF46 TaxID=3233019 RepID=UPI003F90B74B
MATYIAFGNFTEQGIRNAKDSPKRKEEFKEMAKQLGVTVKDVYWTLGRFDIVLILEAQDDAVAAELGLNLGKLGNVRTETMRAFGPTEVTKLLDRIA